MAAAGSVDATSPGSSSTPAGSGLTAPLKPFHHRRGSDTQGIISIAVIATMVGVIALICWHSVPVENKDALEILIGVLAGSYKDVIGFFFGSTSSAHEKDSAIAAIATAGGGTQVPAGPASIPAAIDATAGLAGQGADTTRN